jgi:transposase
MARKTAQSRLDYQLFADPLENLIAQDNPVRIIDAFVDALPLENLGFKGVRPNDIGAASYAPADLLKIYFYGYFNRIRSSRMLERECTRNIEMMWLIGRQCPSYHTISTFRTYKQCDQTGKEIYNHRKALTQVFRLFNRFLDHKGLFGKKTFAVDGTKIAAQNSKKQHISEEKTQRKIDRIEHRLIEYLDQLDLNDLHNPDEITADKKAIINAINDLSERRDELLNDQKQLHDARKEDPNITQICKTDPEARMLPMNNEGMMQIAYNVQSAVDDQNYLIADYAIENKKDLYLLAPMGNSVKEQFAIDDDLELLADKGYHSGQQIHECSENGIITYVAFPEQTYRDRPPGFQKENFEYDEKQDVYTCPNHQTLKTSGTWHEKKGRQGHIQTQYKLYRSPFAVCSACPFKDKCLSTSNQKQGHGRTIERSQYEAAALANKQRILRHRDKYKRRQAIVEHPFGTIKRSWGYHYTLLKGKEKVGGEMAIIFTLYNLRRAMSILGVADLILALKSNFLPIFVSTTKVMWLKDTQLQIILWPTTVNTIKLNAASLNRA